MRVGRGSVTDVRRFQSGASGGGAGQSAAPGGGPAGPVRFGAATSTWPRRAATSQAAAAGRKRGLRGRPGNLRPPAPPCQGSSSSTPWWRLSSRSWSPPGGKAEGARRATGRGDRARPGRRGSSPREPEGVGAACSRGLAPLRRQSRGRAAAGGPGRSCGTRRAVPGALRPAGRMHQRGEGGGASRHSCSRGVPHLAPCFGRAGLRLAGRPGRGLGVARARVLARPPSSPRLPARTLALPLAIAPPPTGSLGERSGARARRQGRRGPPGSGSAPRAGNQTITGVRRYRTGGGTEGGVGEGSPP